jgi:DNA polymerase-3 subunit alpha
MCPVKNLVDKAVAQGMPAVALTDHGNMFGIKEFFDCVEKKNEKLPKEQQIKPIAGCEVYVARRTRHDKDKNLTEERNGKTIIIDRGGEHLIVLAKNKTGYANLCKIVSLSWLEGHYYHPRVDKELLEKYHEGLIVCSACLGGELHRKLHRKDTEGAEAAARWYKGVFGDDYYIELQLHPPGNGNENTETYEQQRIQNAQLLDIARRTDTKIIVSNDVHFLEQEHADAHDRLICVSTGKDFDAPDRMRYTKQEWFKTEEEMRALFPDLPEAFANTVEIANKVETYNISSEALMPQFPIPAEFGTVESYRDKFAEDALRQEFGERFDKLGGYDKVLRIKLEADYLKHLTMEGASERYGNPIPADIAERIDFELDTMKTMGFPGYFLIVYDFISEARKMGVVVGPGRGSAAGSVVAYCLKITDLDPLQYDLLFERFLNPDRVSMPDIDIDFDDDGRGKVLEYVTNKYGADRVARIITYGTMAARSAIKDVARVQKLTVEEANKLAAYIPFRLNDADVKVTIANCIEHIPDFKKAAESADMRVRDTLRYAQQLEGTVRQTGVHACGIIIGADDLINYVPLATADDKETGNKLVVTQYEGTQMESVGLIKMDFLGLTTLSIIKDALATIKQAHNKVIDIDHIPLDDKKTYELFGKGLTIGIFQFESAGMQKYLKQLQPSRLDDLIAMNALYRPGPMDNIPQYIARKQGAEQVTYEFPEMEKRLKDTYGVTIYQEQVMLLSRDLAGFTRGQSDTLRKAMGKKQKYVLDKLQPDFIKGATDKGFDKPKLEKIWSDWEAFASYAFNKSHSACYAWIAYQTAYLKAHYPSEFMAAAVGRALSDTSEIKKYMDECRRMHITVLTPDVNESNPTFTVDKASNIRFGLSAIKGVGLHAAEAIIKERSENGAFSTVFNFVERVPTQTLNKRVMEALAGAGAFDSLGVPRPAYFADAGKGATFTDALLKYGAAVQQEKGSTQQSLFGEASGGSLKTPAVPPVNEYSQMEFLNKERDLIGIYLSSHPLDKYKDVIKAFVNRTFSELQDVNSLPNSTVIVAGRVNKIEKLLSKNNKDYCRIKMEDYSGTRDWVLFGKEYEMYYPKLRVDEYYIIAARIQEKAVNNYSPFAQSADRPKDKELKIGKIEMLEEVSKRGLHHIAIDLPVDKVTATFVEDLSGFAADGATPKRAKNLLEMKINLFCDGMRLDCRAAAIKVPFDDALTDFLDENELKYMVR